MPGIARPAREAADMRVFLDASILFSAAKSDGAIRALLHLLHARGHECHADAYVVAEARRNLEAKGREALGALDPNLAEVQVAPTLRMTTAADAGVDWLSAKDRPVLVAAIRLGCDALVTSDRTHFGPGYGRTFGGVTIHSPRSLAEWLLPATAI
jgi:predicted nucleic acid-binding protein